MPEGHTIHRLARRHTELVGGRTVGADSPQGPFAAGAARIDGHLMAGVEAWGKHLFYDVTGAGFVHVHLGLFGKYRDGPLPAPEASGALRLRLITDEHWIELRGATTCELLDPPDRQAILDRLGPDPIRRDVRAADFVDRAARSRAPVAGILMDQKLLAGVGNVYRAEVLFRQRLPPYAPGRAVGADALQAVWADLVVLMRAGVRSGRIVTTLATDRGRKGPVTSASAHYVYRRHGEPCRVCGTPIARAELAGRNLFWCPTCQAG